MLVIGQQGKVPAELNDGREFAILIEGLMDRVGGCGIYDEHVGTLHESPSRVT